MISISIRDTATPTVQGLMDRIAPADLTQIAGRTGANTVKTWLRQRNETHPNKLGGKRTNFWSKAASSVHSLEDGDSAIIYASSTGILLQRYGGTVKPINAKRLAIPARAEAHGKVPSDFNDLSFWMDKEGHMGLVQNDATAVSFGRQRKDGTRKVKQGEERGALMMFWLVRQAQIEADETVLPPDDLIRDAVEFNMFDYVVRNAGRIADER